MANETEQPLASNKLKITLLSSGLGLLILIGSFLFDRFNSIETSVRANFATLGEMIRGDEAVIHRLETKIALLEQEAHNKHTQLEKQVITLTNGLSSMMIKTDKNTLSVGELNWRFKGESKK